MKKKIIALFLLIAMLVGVLASCGYSYSEDDMSAYVSMSKADFVKKLKEIKIEDALFTNDEPTRQNQVSDAIVTALANLDKTQRKSGKADGYDVVYYYYFVVDGDPASYDTPESLAAHTYVAYNSEKHTSLMTGTASNIVLGLLEIEDDSFTKAFYDAWKNADFEFKATTEAKEDDKTTDGVDESAPAVPGNIYEIINSSSTTEQKKTTVTRADIIYVTYTKKWTEKDNNGNPVEMSEIYTDIRLWDRNTDTITDTADPFFSKFIGKTVGALENFSVGEGENEVKYSNVRINAIHKTPKTSAADKTFGAPIVIKYNPYIEGTQTKLTSVLSSKNGTAQTITLEKDKDLTYFIYPAYYTDTKNPENLNAQEILEDLFGKSVTVDMFSEDALKYKGKVGDVEKTLEAIIKGESDSSDDAWKESIKVVFSYITDATKHADYDKTLDGKKDSDEKPVKNSKEEIKARYEGYLKTRVEFLNAITNGKTGDDEKKAAEILMDEYRTMKYETLEDEYYKEIEHNVQHEIVEIIEALEIKTLPEDAVDEIYEILFENEKYYFNEEKDSDESSKTYNKEFYAIHNGDFDAYFIDKCNKINKKNGFVKGEIKTVADAEAVLRKKAEAFVAFSVKLYFAAEAFGVKIADDEYEELYESSYGEQGAKLASQLDKLFDKLLLMKGEEDFFKKEENAGKTYDRQLDENKNIRYENIGYVLDKAEDK